MDLNDFRIYIPTYKRIYKQYTYYNLPDVFKPYIELVCTAEEAPMLLDAHPNCTVKIQPDSSMTIAKKRAWLIEQCSASKMFMFDDDLKFCPRYSDNIKLYTPEHNNDQRLIDNLVEIFNKLDYYAHVGVSPRLANNRYEDDFKENSRMVYSLGYRPQVLRENCELGRIETREDMDYTLQLLRAGYKNIVGYKVACDQKGFNSEGGASEERSMERSNSDAEKLSELHPGFVRVVNREYKNSLPRKEVVVGWKKAFQSSQID